MGAIVKIPKTEGGIANTISKEDGCNKAKVNCNDNCERCIYNSAKDYHDALTNELYNFDYHSANVEKMQLKISFDEFIEKHKYTFLNNIKFKVLKMINVEDRSKYEFETVTYSFDLEDDWLLYIMFSYLPKKYKENIINNVYGIDKDINDFICMSNFKLTFNEYSEIRHIYENKILYPSFGEMAALKMKKDLHWINFNKTTTY